MFSFKTTGAFRVVFGVSIKVKSSIFDTSGLLKLSQRLDRGLSCAGTGLDETIFDFIDFEKDIARVLLRSESKAIFLMLSEEIDVVALKRASCRPSQNQMRQGSE